MIKQGNKTFRKQRHVKKFSDSEEEENICLKKAASQLPHLLTSKKNIHETLDKPLENISKNYISRCSNYDTDEDVSLKIIQNSSFIGSFSPQHATDSTDAEENRLDQSPNKGNFFRLIFFFF